MNYARNDQLSNQINPSFQGGAAKKPLGQDRQLNLAELMKTSSVYKTGANSGSTSMGATGKNMGGMSLTGAAVGLHPNEFIKGTQVKSDFQLIAEPLQPKIMNMNGAMTVNQNYPSQSMTSGYLGNSGISGFNHPSSAQKQPAKANSQTIATHSHPNTATGNTNSEQGVASNMFALPTNISSNIATQNHQASKQALENYYSNAGKIQGTENQQNITTITAGNQYQSNRSVAAKAGQMQIFNTDAHSKFGVSNPQLNSAKHINSQSGVGAMQSSILGGNTQAAKKFVSPPASHYGKFSQHVMQQQQQQLTDAGAFRDLPSIKGSNNGSQGIYNPKYVDYINRFQVQVASDKEPSSQSTQDLSNNRPSLYGRSVHEEYNANYNPSGQGSEYFQNATLQDECSPIDGGASINNSHAHNHHFSHQNTTNHILMPLDVVGSGAGSSYKHNPNLSVSAQPPQRRQGGTSTTLNNLNISGEQMQIDSKSFQKKVTLGFPSQGIPNNDTSSIQYSQQQQQLGNRNHSLSQKRQDLTVQAKSFAKQAQKLTGSHDDYSNVLSAMGSGQANQQFLPVNYDYVFIQLSHETFDREFLDKTIILKDSLTGAAALNNSPSLNSVKQKRATLIQMNNSVGKSNQNQSQTQRYKNVRGSTDSNQPPNLKDSGLFSPQMGHSIVGVGLEDLTQIQASMDNKYNFINVSSQLQAQSQMVANGGLCLQSTTIDHMKVIINPQLSYQQSDSEQIAEYVQDIIKNVEAKGRRVKITKKKNYLHEAVKEGGRKVASMYVIVVGCYKEITKGDSQVNTIAVEGESKELIKVEGGEMQLGESGDESELSEFTQTMTNLKQNFKQQANGRGLAGEAAKKFGPQPQGKIRPLRMRNNSTINSKSGVGTGGEYESETETRSMNSTTTSSTAMHFMANQTRNHNKGGELEKSSARSMSQKGPTGSVPRRLGQKAATLEDGGQSSLLQTQNFGYNNNQANLNSKYGPTKIRIIQNWEDYAHHKDHRINACLNNYNSMIQLLFRTKGKLNLSAIFSLSKAMGLQGAVSKNMFNGDGVLKGGREQANMIKEKLIAYLCKVMQEENVPTSSDIPGCEDQILQPQQQYKCYVGKGNNSILIRTLFKTRYWWLLHDKEEIDKVNFMWTQLRKNPIMDTFPCKFEDKKSGLKLSSANAPSNFSSTSTLIQTPTMSSGKMKKKKKNQLQSSTQSLESSGDKKDTTLGLLNTAEKQGKDNQQTAGGNAGGANGNGQDQLKVKLYNKLEDNFHLSNKKAMFLNIRIYYEAMGKDVFTAVPVTFHIKEGLEDPEFARFKAFYNKEEEEVKRQKQEKTEKKMLALKEQSSGQAGNTQTSSALNENGEMKESLKKNIWIIKPGENTNRGNGIMVSKDYEEIKSIILESTANKKRTCIVQKYIHNPLLINKRKFDIRLYAFMSSINGNLKAYFYQDGYLRTSCREFTLQNLSNRMIHLTNDAVQKKAEDYGKYEAGNKLSYTDFQNYLDKNFSELSICFDRDLLPQMKKLVTDTFRAVYGKLDPKRRINTFEIYGFDFMFDEDFKVYLIEVNTNPCLELGCPLLARLIPGMVENALRIVVDPLFPPAENWSQKKCVVNDVCPDNKFELIFDEKIDGPYLTELMKEKNNIIIEIDEEELSDCDLEENDN